MGEGGASYVAEVFIDCLACFSNGGDMEAGKKAKLTHAV